MPKSPGLTIFCLPKAFAGHIGVIQENAVRSWTKLDPVPQILLFGDEVGTRQVAASLGVKHVPGIRRNEWGTPLMDGMFREAHRRASFETMMYINADILLLPDFSRAFSAMEQSGFASYLLIGRRTDVNVTAPLDFEEVDWDQKIFHKLCDSGKVASRVCKDYFLFRKPLFREIPPFAVGRSPFDNWLVYHAKKSGVPVVDATDMITAIHQNHTYAHVPGGRRHAYLFGKEARRNHALAGGARLISGSTVTWKITKSGMSRRRLPFDICQFLQDLPKFFRLTAELIGVKSGGRS